MLHPPPLEYIFQYRAVTGGCNNGGNLHTMFAKLKTLYYFNDICLESVRYLLKYKSNIYIVCNIHRIIIHIYLNFKHISYKIYAYFLPIYGNQFLTSKDNKLRLFLISPSESVLFYYHYSCSAIHLYKIGKLRW